VGGAKPFKKKNIAPQIHTVYYIYMYIIVIIKKIRDREPVCTPTPAHGCVMEKSLA